jgi:hypothetical protein
LKAQERKVPYKRPLKEGHVEGYHQNLPGFLGAFLPPHRFLPPDIGSLAHSDGFFFFFPIIYNYSKKRRERQKKTNKFSKNKK